MGIDLGTSSLKTLLMDEDGRVKAICAQDYQFDSPLNGYAEQDPEVWWKACVKTVRDVLSKANTNPEEIAGVSFSGQMHGAVLLDENGKVVRPAILHCDARSSEQVRKMKEILGPDRNREWMMNPVYPGFLLVSLMWVKDNEPENYKRVRHAFLPKDYIKYRLSGKITSDYSDASATLAFDIRNGKWSKEILNAFSVREDIFPPCFNTDEVIGTVSEEASKETGLSVHTKVISGGGDQVMQGIGNGITAPGGSSVNIGTSGQVSFQSEMPVLNPHLSTNTFCGYKKGRWIVMGATMNAGLSLKWCNRLLGQTDYAKMNEEVSRVSPGSGGLIFLPYLNGERTPHLNPDISGEWVGLNINTGAAEATRSVMEGVAFALNQCMEVCADLGLKAMGTMIASGGGARSMVWLHIQSDVYGIPLKVADTEEQASLGAAIAAGVGAGIYQDIEEGCRRAVRYKDFEVEPDENNHRIYREYYELFKEVYVSGEKALNKVTLLGRKKIL